MAKILHTADLHLKEYGDERWEALQQLVHLGELEEIDLLVISGDLFNKGIDGENLRNYMRQVFDHTNFSVAILPGNHDRNAYAGGKYYGRNVVVMSGGENPLVCRGSKDNGEVLVWGLPCEELTETEIVRRLHRLSAGLPRDKCNVLLYHGELLDPRFSRSEMGDEDDYQRYMPVKLSYFEDLGFNYVLAGHFHTSFNIWRQGGCYFVYPGSPVSITRKETGRRKVNLFYSGEPPGEYLLDTFHYERVTVKLDPLSAVHPLEEVERSLRQRHSNAVTELYVKGYMNGAALGTDETRLAEQIYALASGAGRVNVVAFDVKDIHEIMQDRLFQRFMAKLEAREMDKKDETVVYDLVIQAMLEARG